METKGKGSDHTQVRPEGQETGSPISRRKFLKSLALVAGGAVVTGMAAACGATPTPTAPPAAAQPTKPAAQPTTAPAAQPTTAPAPTKPPAAAATVAPAAGSPKAGGKMVWALESDPVNLIPYGGVSTSNQWGKEFIYDSLVEWDKDLKVLPALAESWETPDDKTWIWHLKKGIKYHDGNEVTADDVKYSIELQANPPAPGIKVGFYPKIASVDVVDKYTAKFNMTGPDPTVLGYLAWARYSPIIPKGLYDKINVLTQGIGTGPYKLVEYVANDHVQYTKNKDFWKSGVPYFDELTLKVLPDENARVAALRSGAIMGCTVSADTARSLQNDPNVSILKGLTSAPRVLQFTMKSEGKPWDKKGVRQAISMTINRQTIIDNVYGGQAVLTGPIPPGYGDWFIPSEELAAKWYKVDVAAAKKLMSDAGFKDGFDITLHAISAPNDYTQIAEIVKEQLKQIGVNVKVVSEEIGTFAKRIGDGTFEWGSTGRGMRADPTNFVVDFGRPDVGAAAAWFNKGLGWKSQELSDLFEKALVNLDNTTRHQQVRRIQELVLDEAPHVYTVQNYKFHAISKHLQNMYVSFTDFHPGLRMAWLDNA